MFQQPWEDNVCLNFLHAVLDWLREEVQDDEPRALCYGGQDKSDELLLVRAPALPSQEVSRALLDSRFPATAPPGGGPAAARGPAC